MIVEELSSRFEAVVSSLQFRVSNHFCDFASKISRERWIGEDIFDSALRICSDQADRKGGGGIERMRNGYFARLQTILISHMLFCRHKKPDGCVIGRRLGLGIIVILIDSQQVLL